MGAEVAPRKFCVTISAGGEIHELCETVRRRGFLGFLRCGFQAVRNVRSTLRGEPWNGLRPGRTMYFVSPIWAGRPSPAARAFLLGARDRGMLLDGVTVHIITVQGDPELDRSPEVHDELAEMVMQAGGTVAQRTALSGAPPGRTGTSESLEAQILARM